MLSGIACWRISSGAEHLSTRAAGGADMFRPHLTPYARTSATTHGLNVVSIIERQRFVYRARSPQRRAPLHISARRRIDAAAYNLAVIGTNVNETRRTGIRLMKVRVAVTRGDMRTAKLSCRIRRRCRAVIPTARLFTPFFCYDSLPAMVRVDAFSSTTRTLRILLRSLYLPTTLRPAARLLRWAQALW